MLAQDFKPDPPAKIPKYKLCAVRLQNPRARVKKKVARQKATGG
jgi:hypothetical protein